MPLSSAVRQPLNRAPVPADAELRRAVDLLHRRAGDHAMNLPVAAGRPALRLEALLASGPTAVDPSSVEPSTALAGAEQLLHAAGAALATVTDEVQVLGEALFGDLTAFRLDAMFDVAQAVLELSEMPRAVSRWGTLAGAAAAERVLGWSADDLRIAARSHTVLYERFTGDIWQVPDSLLEKGRSRWRPVSRVRLRQELRAVSRTGRLPDSLTAVSTQVLAARADRQRLASQSPLLTRHLGDLDRGPLTDADGVLATLAAVRRLQAALGRELDEARLQQLLFADAFHSSDVTEPAANVRDAIRGLVDAVDAVGGGGATRLRPVELAFWALECGILLPTVVDAREATARAGAAAPTLRNLVDLLLLREHVDGLAADEPQLDQPHRLCGAS